MVLRLRVGYIRDYLEGVSVQLYTYYNSANLATAIHGIPSPPR